MLKVKRIVGKLGDGCSVEDLPAGCPDLVREDIQASRAYAADYLAMDETVFRPAGSG